MPTYSAAIVALVLAKTFADLGVVLKFDKPLEAQLVTNPITISLHVQVAAGPNADRIRLAPANWAVCFGLAEDALGWLCTCQPLQNQSLMRVVAPQMGRTQLLARLRHVSNAADIVASTSVDVEVVESLLGNDEFKFASTDSKTRLMSRAYAFVRRSGIKDEVSISQQANLLAESAAQAVKRHAAKQHHGERRVALILAGQARSFQVPVVYGSIRTNLVRALSHFTDVFAAVSLDDKDGRETIRDDAALLSVMNALEALQPAAATIHFREPPGDGLHGANADCGWRLNDGATNEDNWGRLVPQYTQLWRGFRLATEMERDGGFRYEWIVRHRPDKLVYDRLPPVTAFPSDRVYIDAIVKPPDLFHVHDHFWLAPRDFAEDMFKAGYEEANDFSCLSREWAHGINAHVFLFVAAAIKKRLPMQIYDFPIARLSAPNERVSWSVGWLSTQFEKSRWPEFAALMAARTAIACNRLAGDKDCLLPTSFDFPPDTNECVACDNRFELELPSISPQLQIAGWAPSLRLEGVVPRHIFSTGARAALEQASLARERKRPTEWWIDSTAPSVTVALHEATIALWNSSLFAVDAVCNDLANVTHAPSPCRSGKVRCLVREVFRGSDYAPVNIKRSPCPCVRELGCEQAHRRGEGDTAVVYHRTDSAIWGVVTTINPPTRAVRTLAAMLPERVVVVGDEPTDDDAWRRAVDAGLRVVYLSFGVQRASRWRIAAALPKRSYTRKMLGYLRAVEGGAEMIYETDDDNEYLFDGIATINQGALLPSLIPPLLKSSLTAGGSKSALPIVNAYAHFGAHDAWPRGVPIEQVAQLTRAPLAYGPSRPRRCLIQQGLADGDPDLDAVYRLIKHDAPEFNFADPIAIQRGAYSPWNSQNTLIDKAAFWALLLPITVSFRLTDIWRSYWTQRLLWHIDGDLCFLSPTVKQRRNAHDNFYDFLDEIQMYRQAGALVRALDAWQPHTSPLHNSSRGNVLSLPTLMLQLLGELAEAGFFGENSQIELQLASAWIQDLQATGYSFPRVLVDSQPAY